MIDMGSIAALTGSLQTAVEITKSLIGLRDATLIQDKAIELQGAILAAQQSALTAQSAQFALSDRVRELEQEIVQLKDWEGEKQRYELQTIDGRAFAYMPKPGMANGEPPHWLCANCFNRRQKAFLQFKGQDRTPNGSRDDTATYGCDACKGSLKVHYSKRPSKPSTGGPRVVRA
jgi:hypothetical protein